MRPKFAQHARPDVRQRQTHWREPTSRALARTPSTVRPWIELPSSMTMRIEEATAMPVRVAVLRDSHGCLHKDERRGLNMCRPAGNVREVLLEAGGNAVLMARSVWDSTRQRNDAQLQMLGNRPLGGTPLRARQGDMELARIRARGAGPTDVGRLRSRVQGLRRIQRDPAARELDAEIPPTSGLPRSGYRARRTLYLWEGLQLLVVGAFLPSHLAYITGTKQTREEEVSPKLTAVQLLLPALRPATAESQLVLEATNE